MTERTEHDRVAFAEADEMYAYYEAQAATYEDFYFGRGQAVEALALEYHLDRTGIQSLLHAFGQGDVIDLACGTAFWLPVYGHNCSTVTLVDQSEASLERCHQRVGSMGLERVARIIQGDLFTVALAPAAYDAGFVGFLLSHLREHQVDALFDRLRVLLRSGAELAIVDSSWSEARRPFRSRDGMETRRLPDGRAFFIRKRYFELSELQALLQRAGFESQRSYVGNVFIGVIAKHAV